VGSREVACSDLAIPVYLDTEALYGIWGTITGGFSVAEQKTIKSATTETEGSSVAGGGGLNVVSMVKLGAEASKTAGTIAADEVVRSLDLFQTNEALLNNLRLVLGEKIIKNIKEYTWEEIVPADIVELRGLFSQMDGAGYSELLGSEQSAKLSPTMLNRELEIGHFGITLTEKPKGGTQEEKYYVGVNLFLKYTRGGTFVEIHGNELNLLGKIASKKTARTELEKKAGNLLKIVPVAVFA
jgi:hypothetical protein